MKHVLPWSVPDSGPEAALSFMVVGRTRKTSLSRRRRRGHIQTEQAGFTPRIRMLLILLLSLPFPFPSP